MKTKILSRFAAAALVPLLLSCGGPPAQNAMLVDARTAFDAAQTDAVVVQYAPVELKIAEEALVQSQTYWKAEADRTRIEHFAYLASQRTAIAVETARMKAAQSEIEKGEVERQRVLLDVRRADAARSERRADAALDQARTERSAADQARLTAEAAGERAEASHLQAEASRLRSEALSRRLAELEAKPTERGIVLTLGDVLFDTGAATLRSGGNDAMSKLAAFMNEYPERTILVEGFTDNVGSAAFNQGLSNRRAEHVKAALTSKGIASSRIRTAGYGLRYPVSDNATNAGRAQNRRVEIVISDTDGVIKDRN